MFVMHHPDEHLHVEVVGPTSSTRVYTLCAYAYHGPHGNVKYENVHKLLNADTAGVSCIVGPVKEYNDSVRPMSLSFFNSRNTAVKLRFHFHGVPSRTFADGETEGHFPIMEKTIPGKATLIWCRARGWYLFGDLT